MIVFGNSTNYQSPSAALLHTKPVMASLNASISIPLPTTEPTYDDKGRQSAFTESALQRAVRLDFMKQRTGTRVEDWVKTQIKSSSSSSQLSATQQPQRPKAQSHSHRRTASTSKPRTPSPLSMSSFMYDADSQQIVYGVPEDSPDGYREPYIFYSSSDPISLVPEFVAPTPKYPPQVISISPASSPSSSPTLSPRRRHQRRLSDLDDIPELEE
ncbi:hypothetical protein C8J56DRAFT_424435 [Mycena floridula]|nr:hypothetical protein C8J56DRAFT_424435 [Mycena floridula]